MTVFDKIQQHAAEMQAAAGVFVSEKPAMSQDLPVPLPDFADWLEGEGKLLGPKWHQVAHRAFEAGARARMAPPQERVTTFERQAHEWKSHAESLQERVRELEQELSNIANAKRFDREHFSDDEVFADWAQSRSRWVLTRGHAAPPSQEQT